MIVGSYDQNFPSLAESGFADINGQFQAINVPGAPSTFVTAVNASGDIIGNDVDQSGNDHLFVATAEIPEPPSALVFAALLPMLALCKRPQNVTR